MRGVVNIFCVISRIVFPSLELSANAGVLVSDCWPIAIDCRIRQQRVPKQTGYSTPALLNPERLMKFLKEIRP